jgi:DNA-binding response OmpR family regulator
MANILIVDGHRHVAELLTEELAAEGYDVDSIGDPESVTERITRFRPNLVLLDLYLNRTTRWDVLSDIKLRHPLLPVLIFTAYDGYMKDPRVSQADGFVVKSVFFESLKEQVDVILNAEPVYENKALDISIPLMWGEQRSGADRRRMERRNGERRSGKTSLAFLRGHQANRRSGLDRRQRQGRQGERRKAEQRAVSCMLI